MTDPGFGPDPLDAPPLRWGIIGAGGIARTFVGSVPGRTRSQVVAIGSRSQERADAFAAELGIPAAYGSYPELVADDDVDAVYIASPHSEHRDHALLALAAGKPVLVEKSFTQNAAQAREVLDAAGEAGLFAMEAMWTRFLPHVVALKEVLDSGAIGEVVTLIASHGQPIAEVPRMARPELAGGALLDLGIYPVAFAFDVLGTPETVDARGWLTEAGVDATLAITFGYGSRAVAQLSTTMLARTHNVAEIAGTRGRITVAETYYAPSSFTVHPLDGEPWTVRPQVEVGLQHEAAEVARCVAAGETSSVRRSWAETIATMEAMDEIRRQVGAHYPGD